MNANKAQITNTIVTLIMLLGGGWLAAHGITIKDVTTGVLDVASLAGIVGAWATAHNFHGKNPPSSSTKVYNGPQKLPSIMITAGLCLALGASSGCAYLNSTTRHETITRHEGTNIVVDVVETTHGRAFTFMDANSSLTKFRNQSSPSTNGTNTFAPGTFASGIGENSSGSNVVNIASSVAAAAVQAAVNAAK